MSYPAHERFLVLRQVAAGGFGSVYQSRDQLDGREVALKILHGGDPIVNGRFQREAAVLAQLTHPSIVGYVGHGRTATGQGYLAMEWLEGETLKARLSRTRTLSLEECATVLARLLAALGYLAERNIVHRDIKPSNVFLVAGDVARTKLLDFGLARSSKDTQELSVRGLAVGTPRYMAPEQARGEHDFGPSADLFSLGSLMYECLTGVPAFGGTDLSLHTRQDLPGRAAAPRAAARRCAARARPRHPRAARQGTAQAAHAPAGRAATRASR